MKYKFHDTITKDFLKFLAYSIKSLFSRSAKQVIFVHGSRRSGGTWFVESISKSLNKPRKCIELLERTKLNPFLMFFNRKENKRVLQNAGIPRSNGDVAIIFNLFNEIIMGKSTFDEIRIWRRDFSFTSEALVVKTHNSKYILRDFVNQFRFSQHIVIVRNPVSQALSSQKYKSSVRYEKAVFANDFLKNKYPLDIVERIGNYKVEHDLTKYVIDWCFENYFLLSEPNISVIEYEELVDNLPEIVKKIKQEYPVLNRLKVEDFSDISSTTDKARLKEFKSIGTAGMARDWFTKVEKAELLEIEEILLIFGYKKYNSQLGEII